MPDVEITHEMSGKRGRYVAPVEGADPAELTTFELRPGVLVADHTFVPVEARGKGIAQALVERLFADARKGGLRIVPGCSYVRSYAARHRDATADVIVDR